MSIAQFLLDLKSYSTLHCKVTGISNQYVFLKLFVYYACSFKLHWLLEIIRMASVWLIKNL